MAVLFDPFGVTATVTRPAPDSDPITTRVVWLAPDQIVNPIGLDDQRFQPNFQRRDPVLIMALRRDEVPTVPRGTRIVAPPLNGHDDELWMVDGTLAEDREHVKVAVLKLEEPV